MKCVIKYKYIEDGQILVKEFKGIITIQDIIDSWQGLIVDGKLAKPIKGVITDFRAGKRNVEVSELAALSNFYKEQEDVFSSVKLAQIIDSPNVSLPMLFEKQNPYLQSRSFSSVDAAKEWIMEDDPE